MSLATEAGAAGSNEAVRVGVLGKRRLTPAELHAQRVEWGKVWGQVGREIKQAHEQRGV